MTKTMHVLYVEDDKTVRDTMLLFFKSYFKKVVCACSGEEGFRYFQEGDFDLIITDINMPGMNGLEMIRKIRNIDDTVPVVIVSAYSDIHYFQSAIGNGVDGYLIKPLDPNQFDEVIETIKAKITKYKEQEAYLQKQHQRANFDQLTGLYNRYKMDELYEGIVQKRSTFSVALIDLDHFKQINDRYGHEEGDRILTEFAQLFAGRLNASCYVGRWGGEEFIVLFPGLSLQEAKTVLEEARREVSTYDFRLERAVTFSAGIATHREGETLRAIIYRADKALYIAKSSGRDCILAEDAV